MVLSLRQEGALTLAAQPLVMPVGHLQPVSPANGLGGGSRSRRLRAVNRPWCPRRPDKGWGEMELAGSPMRRLLKANGLLLNQTLGKPEKGGVSNHLLLPFMFFLSEERAVLLHQGRLCVCALWVGGFCWGGWEACQHMYAVYMLVCARVYIVCAFVLWTHISVQGWMASWSP